MTVNTGAKVGGDMGLPSLMAVQMPLNVFLSLFKQMILNMKIPTLQTLFENTWNPTLHDIGEIKMPRGIFGGNLAVRITLIEKE